MRSQFCKILILDKHKFKRVHLPIEREAQSSYANTPDRPAAISSCHRRTLQRT
jgi:hypothetical protein